MPSAFLRRTYDNSEYQMLGKCKSALSLERSCLHRESLKLDLSVVVRHGSMPN